jgi:hypothetical protein
MAAKASIMAKNNGNNNSVNSVAHGGMSKKMASAKSSAKNQLFGIKVAAPSPLLASLVASATASTAWRNSA